MEYYPKIALSKGSGSPKYGMYESWLRSVGNVAEVIDLWSLPAAQRTAVLNECDGIVFTGGPDISPDKHEQAERADECVIDTLRDDVEFSVFEQVRELKMPVLGICRGLQLINVALGGRLYIDIPTDIQSDTEHRSMNNEDSTHEVETAAGSMIKKICRTASGKINSAHHQAASVLPQSLRVAAIASDGVIEAVEWSEPMGKGFLLGVQWHPERMDFNSPFSLPIARHFLFEAESYAALYAKRLP
ncbi:hypothetical protein MASR2M18_19670 [Ignavibacteria bacterium]|nr:gamma-glutamyl-gamma-aminobutyrate hydrolase family protein [Bacteroidota bacterium]MCZ2131620.1 gamma-glutamyl-gamma-aminobutyrate hydrolase family protein [Bacteroidota bacterium]